MFHPKRFVAKGFLSRQIIATNKQNRESKMSDKLDHHKMQELKEMIKQKNPNESVDKVLAVFCERHALSMGSCRYYYNLLVERGKIKEK